MHMDSAPDSQARSTARRDEPGVRIPWRIAIVQRTLPHYRLAAFGALLAAAAPGSILLHGAPSSKRQPKQNAYAGATAFPREVLPSWSMSLRIGEQLIFPVFMPGLAKALARARPDVIITEGESNLLNNFLVTRYARRHNIPYIWWGLGAIPGASRSGLRRVLAGPLTRMISEAAGIACYSTYARDFYIGQGAFPGGCRVVPNALGSGPAEEGLSAYGAEAQRLRREAGVHDDDLVLLSVGSLEAPKRIDLALDAFERLQGRLDRRIHLWIVGDGPERARLESLARSPDVRFWGARYDDVSLYFLMSDIFVLPGLGGLSINQAMMHGLPVVCGPADGTERDLLQGGEGGCLLDELTSDSLASAIAEMSRRDLRAMGRAAMERVQRGFSIDAQIQSFAGLIGDIMTARHERGASA
jgi:glycosyltransferase involved in cell wall biosynthesis